MSTYLSLGMHMVFATDNRAPTITEDLRGNLHAYIGGTVRALGAEPIIVGGVADHVHMLVKLKATHCVADVMREVKKTSSIWMSEPGRRPNFRWQTGYGAFAVSQSDIDTVVAYIANQEEHHRNLASGEELRKLLVAHGVEIDERYFK